MNDNINEARDALERCGEEGRMVHRDHLRAMLAEVDRLTDALASMRAHRDEVQRLADELRAQRNAAHDQLADISALAGGLMDPDERSGGDRVLGEAWSAVCALRRERDELRATLARLQTPASDLPPVGTRWGDLTDEQRARLPVGTVLAAPRGIDWPELRLEDGVGVGIEEGERISLNGIADARRILSYPAPENP